LILCACGAFIALASAANAEGLQVSTQPALYPAFDPAVTDYVTRCTAGTPVSVTVSAPAGTEVDVDGQGSRSGDFSTAVELGEGWAFRIDVASETSTSSHHVRCLPSDFPAWTFQRSDRPQAEWYAVAPFLRTDFQPAPAGVSLSYAALFDPNGVPVWWMKSDRIPLDFHPLSNGDLIVTHLGFASSEEYRLDGSLVRTLTPVGSDIASDGHETLLLPDGNYLLTVERILPGQSACGQSNISIADSGFQEITPDGSLVREWFASDHIPLSEIPAEWCNQIISRPANGVYDVYHENSLEPDGSDMIVSFRHLDAVYKIAADGNVVWKLGGAPRPESLTVVGDPVFAAGGDFGGQHDARVLGDGTVTIHDNGYHPSSSRPPRAVRYAIDTNAKTATLVEQETDPAVGTPLCCGSARKLPGGDWVMSWGSAGLVTELSPSGTRVFSLTFDDGLFSYRAHPVLFGTLSRTALRDGMDARVPHPTSSPATAPVAADTLAPEVSGFSLSRKRFRVGSTRTPVSASTRHRKFPRGTSFRFKLSERANVQIVIERAHRGRRVALTRNNRPAGPNTISFSGRAGRRALKRGRYRATIAATDGAGNRSKTRRASFTIMR
jgi:hypothetical protein